MCINRKSVKSQATNLCGKRAVIGHKHAAFTTCNCFNWMQRENRGAAISNFAPLVMRANGVRGVL